MKSCRVILLEKDVRIARALALSLQPYFSSVAFVSSRPELRSELQEHGADLLILDVESSCFGEVHHLREEFPKLSIVCTHRLADEQMWAEALDAGADDLCAAADLGSIVRSAMGQMQRAASAAA